MNRLLKEQAKSLDIADPLAKCKQQFSLPTQVIYLDGNSLGALPLSAEKRAQEVVKEQWGKDLIKSWNCHQWIDLPEIVGAKLSRIIGCAKDEVICCDSISVNLTKVLCSALSINSERKIIMSESGNFPTDLYMVQGLQALLGEKRCELLTVDVDNIESVIDARGNEIALLLLSHVDFRTGKIKSMEKITQIAHDNGVLVCWDLAHSAGILPVLLNQADVDFAVGCTYKYLNGGPGAPGFVYVKRALHERIKQPLTGWMGHATPFDFSNNYEASEGIRAMLAGTPSIISMSVLDAALDVFELLDMHQVWQKSLALSDFFHQCLTQLCPNNGLEYLSPDNAHRGGQLAYTHPHAYQICQALIARNIIGDFRAPNILRLGFSPLYLSYKDMVTAANILADIMQNKTYLAPEYSQKTKVT
ncbi:kynureninase [Glaciecola sp. 1036]|uniref:kynureninase n=1 Tax=Alteromonadaceae TaxID=72275 RepID=UPI003D0302B3